MFFIVFLGTILNLYVGAITLGDSNGDNGVTIVDALIIAQHTAGLKPPTTFNTNTADMNWDGKADINDALLIVQYVAFGMKDYTSFVMSHCNPDEEDPQVYAVKPDCNFRAFMRWDTHGDEPSEYYFDAIKHYHDNNICFIGGGSATIIYEHTFGSLDTFMDMATRDANNLLVRHDEVLAGGDPLYRATLANPKYRKYITDFSKIQIDGGVDGLCFDEVLSGFSGGVLNNYNGNEGFDDYFISDFNKYLIEKYPDYTARYWKEIVNELRAYAREKYNKYIFITSNGIFPFVDFNCLGMYPWNPDEQTPDYRGADYVPVSNGHLNGSKSLMSVYRSIYNKNRETAGNVPLVVFIDWPTEMLTNYNNLTLQEEKDYWQIFGAEAYACGLYAAFHLRDTLGSPTATAVGTLDFFKTYKLFYKSNQDIYNHLNYYYSDKSVSVNKSNIASNLMVDKDGTRYALHLINHNYNAGINVQQNFSVTVGFNKSPLSIIRVS